jgi:hypothetical protein
MKLPLGITCLMLSLTVLDVVMHEVARSEAWYIQEPYHSAIPLRANLSSGRVAIRRLALKSHRRIDLSTYGC